MESLCIVSQTPCTGYDHTFEKCGCQAHRKYVSSWLALPWNKQAGPCPKPGCVDPTAKLTSVSPSPTIVFLDKECKHCQMLDAQIGERGLMECGLERRYVDKSNPFVQRPFPHTYKEDPDTLIKTVVKDANVNMFVMMVNINF